ncbi:hypothetical protein [Acinetobacter beijerinckii]|uniref:Uncharacterized protein n=1 Tax=Acinetobacter beijerinckii ANC 3835 TaxID=1217649 RepID=N9DW12_9GAMM|nr:hypothetical protein [Acinetobacter beijerinckii]ENW02433.1 hypothetical protein F934_03294 [Acinetobacter beijerinckii ANC 3835]
MRSWSLVCASCSASFISVLSFVIPFCLFLNYRQNHLIHVVSDGMEVMMYLIPILIVLAFIFYLIVFAVLKLPTQIFDLYQFLKISFVIFIAWALLVLTILFEDQVNQIDFSTLKIGIMMYFMMLPILALGCMSANSFYFVMSKVNQRKNTTLF